MDPLLLNRLRGVAQGATFGFGDEITSGLSAGLAALNGANFKDAYHDIITDARKDFTQYSKNNPVEATLLELAGGLSPATAISGGLTKLAGVVPRLASKLRPDTLGRAAIEGGGAGALYGLGTGEDSLRNRLGNAGTQAWQGAIAGPLAQGAISAGGKALKAVKDVTFGVNHSKEADKLIADALRHDGVSLSNVTQGRLYEHGGANMDSLIAGSARTSGASPTMYANEAARLRAAAHDDTVDIVQRNIMPVGSTYDVSDPTSKVLLDIRKTLKTQANSLYEQAMKPGTPLYSADLADIGHRLASTPSVMKDALEAGTLTGKKYPTVWSHTPDPSKLNTGITRDRNGLTEYEQIVPDLRFWDSVKKSLWNNGKNSSNKQLYGNLRKELTDVLDTHPSVPGEYKQARHMYEENIGLEEAHELGAKFFDKGTQTWDVRNTFHGIPGYGKGMTQAEQELYLHGVSNAAVDKLGTSPEAARELAKALGSPNQASKLTEVVDPSNLQAIREGVGNQVARLEKADLMTPPVHTNLGNIGEAQASLQKVGGFANVMSGISPGSILNSVARAKAASAIQDSPELGAAVARRMLEDSSMAVPGIERTIGGPLVNYPKLRANIEAVTPKSALMTGQFVGSEPAVPRDEWEP
jgi:hypothetical protein